ncbi:hypothetical protein [Pseudomonas sp. FEN]|uniref:hypothetical protein n=1 Tax=Pseudomonas sp. FEN TaxID=2767468 RepID=UPI00174BADFC|nr:hypothetical protein [Pseudomonas sp. FEN]
MKGRSILLVNQLGGRKFLATVVVGVSTAMLTWYGKIDGGTYAMVILGTVGSFIGGNVYGKVHPRES